MGRSKGSRNRMELGNLEGIINAGKHVFFFSLYLCLSANDCYRGLNENKANKSGGAVAGPDQRKGRQHE